MIPFGHCINDFHKIATVFIKFVYGPHLIPKLYKIKSNIKKTYKLTNIHMNKLKKKNKRNLFVIEIDPGTISFGVSGHPIDNQTFYPTCI